VGFVSKMTFKKQGNLFFVLKLGMAGNIFRSCSKEFLIFS
jgi:hypothetical protein